MVTCIRGLVIPRFANMNVDVEFDLADAGLFHPVRAAFVPAAVACAGIPDIGQSQASPFGQLPRTQTSALPCQPGLFSVFGGGDDGRAEFTVAALIGADDL